MLRDAEDLPHLLSHFEQVQEIMAGRKPLLILDYDGTLSPIVPDPDKAVLSAQMKDVLVSLAKLVSVAVISGRDRADVEQKVGLKQLIYAGSHGLDMAGPEGFEIPEKVSGETLASLKTAAENLSKQLETVKGCMVESKKYAIAVHFRNVAEEEVDQVKNAVLKELERHDNLKKGAGKKILELKPAIDWHKGRAVNWLFEVLDFTKENTIPIFIGDDITDEDAFASIQAEGIGILVGTHGEPTAATFALKDTEEVRVFLEKFYDYLFQQE